jgi:hypothetical protein
MLQPFLRLATALLLAFPLAAQNTNDRAPTATNRLEFAGGGSIQVSYRAFTIAGGRSIKALMTKGEAGAQARQFYNTRYIPGFLHGSLALGQDTAIGGQTVAKGEYRLLFRIDEDLVWHFVLAKPDGGEDVAVIALDTTEDALASARRLAITPVAGDQEGGGALQLQFGSLVAKVEFAVVKPAPAAGAKSGK